MSLRSWNYGLFLLNEVACYRGRTLPYRRLLELQQVAGFKVVENWESSTSLLVHHSHYLYIRLPLG